ncbi:MAG TPA: bifunctional pyr operon transcriptional regulator/uracil phosphoribosyltransferase PyrR [Candidatus Aminicenantes bacterium]|nr:bifunctional pyr operon transcriptional regulator/uracil phosphoribosyltransferase PyrR [Candidatus Aminicenantes bacterium]
MDEKDKVKAKIMDDKKMKRTFQRMAMEILERNRDEEKLALIGIQTRGVVVAQRIQAAIQELEGIHLPLGVLDITFFRDDLDRHNGQPVVKKTDIPFSVKDRDIILIDDVLFTGRTIRAAMDSIFELGRPSSIQLAVFIDRGHRELPICPDFRGKSLPTSHRERVRVMVKECDGKDQVQILEPAGF